MRKTRVLIVDDSAIVRRMLSDALSGEPDIEVVGTAPDPIIAQDKIQRLAPDVLTLDLEMPRMDGLTFLKLLMREHPLPVIVMISMGQASGRAAMEALHCGAIEVLAKPGGPYSVGDLKRGLPSKIRAAAAARLRRLPETFTSRPSQKVPLPAGPAVDPRTIIAMGASTGGTEALHQVMVEMPGNSPGIVIVQHIPAVFSRAFAERLDGCCAMRVKEAEDGDEIRSGVALVAPGNFHLSIRRAAGVYRAVLTQGPPVCYQRPAVDVLFESVAREAGKYAIGVLLTGMGSDGAQGLLAIRQAGARTIAQDEQSCVVFGMPREAIRLGAAAQVLPLDRIAHAVTLQFARPH